MTRRLPRLAASLLPVSCLVATPRVLHTQAAQIDSTPVRIGIKAGIGPIAAFDLALHSSDVTNELIPFEAEDQPGRSYFRNAGSTRHQGAELGMVIEPTRRLPLRGSYTYTDARFQDFTIGDESYDENQIPGVPRHRVQSLLTLSSGSGWHASTDVEYVSETPANDDNTTFSPGYWLVGIRAGVCKIPSGSWWLSPHVWISNLFDTQYNSSVVVNAFGGRYFEPGPGRGVWIGARLRFIGQDGNKRGP